MKKFKKTAFSIVAVAALALTSQASASAHGAQSFDRAMDIAARRAFNTQNDGGRAHRDRVMQIQNFDNARPRNENRILRLESRHGVDTAATLNSLREQRTIRLNSLNLNGLPTDLNLNSRRDNYVLSGLSGNVTISRAGQDIAINNSTKLTAAEVAAVYQVLNENGQSLQLGRKGNADGGSLTLDAAATSGLTSLNVPKNVSVTGDFTNAAELSIGGDLRNAGNLVVRSGDPSLAAATISADNIRNARTGSIATVDTASGALNLNLFANMDIVNQGTISGAGDVTLTAGGSIQNVSDAGSVPTIIAGRNVNLQSANVINQGLVSATAGNINIANQLAGLPTNKVVAINGLGGSFNAANGDITIGSNNFDSSMSVLLSGGDYRSNNLVVNAGAGSADGIVGDVTGQLKVNANVAHIGASTENLVLGQCVIAGDPTFFNNAGNITVSGNLVFNEAIAILASGNVTDGGAASNLTARNGDVGANVTIIAGATLTGSAGANPTTDVGTGTPIAVGTTVKVGKVSKTGGSIDLGATSIHANGQNNGSGGDVLLVALGTKKAGGAVAIKNVEADGAGIGNNGSIAIYANKSSDLAIESSDLRTGNGLGSSGEISLVNNSVAFSKDFTVNADGTYTGTFTTGNKFATGGISSNTIINHGGAVNIVSGGGVTLGAFGGETNTDGLAGGGSAGNIDVVAGSIEVLGNVVARGGNGATDGVSGNGLTGGDGGNITFLSTVGAITINDNLQFRSKGGNGGDGSVVGATAGSGGQGGVAGDVQLFSATDINLGNFGLSSEGGTGGNGANGSAATGMSGGDAGNGGDAGEVSLSSSGGNLTLNSFVGSLGGASGSAGIGADNLVGLGGSGGNGGIGGRGNEISLSTTGSGNINLGDGVSIQSAAGVSLAAGNGGTGETGGGAGGNGGNGNDSGSIFVRFENGTLNFNSNAQILTIAANGGSAGAGGNSTGALAVAGDGGQGNQGGFAGEIVISASLKGGSIVGGANNSIRSIGGHGGNGGAGGSAVGTGDGGNGGDTFEGGHAGALDITGAVINFAGEISARTDNSGFAAGAGGAGGNNISGLAGNGGNGGLVTRNTENGGRGGDIFITGGVVNVNRLDVSGTEGGTGGAGGAGGISATNGDGGDGGNGGAGGWGESGGEIRVTGSQVTAITLDAGGTRGGNGGNAGNGGTAGLGFIGGNGGNGGDGGNQGDGGFVTVTTTKGKTPDINVTTIVASAGGSSTAGSGGNGGVGSNGTGLGGDGGAVGTSGVGNSIEIVSTRDATIGSMTVAGGVGNIAGTGGSGDIGGLSGSITFGTGGTGGDISFTSKKGNLTVGSVNFAGGNGANGVTAGVGNGTRSGDGSDGGAGGTFTVSTSGATTVNNSFDGRGGSGGTGGAGTTDGLGGNGGYGARGGTFTVIGTSLDLNTDASLRGGAGGSGGASGANADGGIAGSGGNGGQGGTLSLSNVKGDTNMNSFNLGGGDGGAGAGGNNSLNVAAVAGGNGGAGGAGGSITTTKVGGDVFATAIRADGGNGGAGGSGSSPTVAPQPAIGPDGANGGSGGNGGEGGAISLLSGKKNVIDSAVSADGGAGGDGGNGGNGQNGTVTTGAGGNGGDGGTGGNGGLVNTSVVPTTPATASGGDGGTGGIGGSGVPQGQPGADGDNGSTGTVTPQLP